MKLKRTDREITFARTQGRKLYALRREQKMTRRQLATATGINQAMLFRLEMGDATANGFQLNMIAFALSVPREQLFPTNRILPMPMKTECRIRGNFLEALA